MSWAVDVLLFVKTISRNDVCLNGNGSDCEYTHWPMGCEFVPAWNRNSIHISPTGIKILSDIFSTLISLVISKSGTCGFNKCKFELGELNRKRKNT